MRSPGVRFTLRRAMAIVALTAFAWWIIVGVVGENQAKAERERCRGSLSQLALALCVYRETRVVPSGDPRRQYVASGTTGRLGTPDPLVDRLLPVGPLYVRE